MKRVTAFALALVLFVLSFSVVSAEEKKSYITGTVSGGTYYYTDEYFAGKASDYDASLATMSYWMADASSGVSADNYAAPYSRLFRLLEEIGFVNPETNEDYKQKPGTDTMGAACAYKYVTLNGQQYTLLVIVPRSGNYEAEWANNFTLGTEGEAAGFAGSAAKVEEFAQAYAVKYESSFVGELKVWVMGYSRGAAVANLVSGHLTAAGKVGNTAVTKENLYGYTFETPRGASTELLSVEEAKTYTNIHNVVTASDLVTKVAPLDFGFIRYGVDEAVIPEERNASNTELFDTAVSYLPEYLAAYTAEGKRIFASEQFQAKKISLSSEDYLEDSSKSMGEFWDDLVSALCLAVGNRTNYTCYLQDSVRLMVSEVMGDSYQSYVWDKALSLLKESLQAHETEIIELALSLNESALEELLGNIFSEAAEASGLDAEAYAKVPAQLVALVPILTRMALADVAIDGGADIVTLIENLDVCLNPHYPDQCAAWLMALDSNYTEAAKAEQARVTEVQVTVTKKTVTRKLLFTKLTTTSYEVNILPVAGMDVQQVEYRTLKLGRLKTGTGFSQSLKPSYLYISVTDAYGNVTHWEYSGGTVSQVQ